LISQAEDFLVECDELYGLLEPIPEAVFDTRTAFKGWTINSILRHLHLWNWGANLSLKDTDAFLVLLHSMKDYIATGNLTDFEADVLHNLSGRALLDEWHRLYREAARTFGSADPAQRVMWVGPSMSIRSSITARQMETWAHGQAIYDEFGLVRKNTDRIRNIVILGVNTYAWSFRAHGIDAPQPCPFVKLTAPSGAVWCYGNDNPDERIEGSAEEFCQVVTQTRNIADLNLSVRGRNATMWMATAQCFAGRAEAPPTPGSRGTRKAL